MLESRSAPSANAERDEQKREEFIAEIEALPEDSELCYIDESGFDRYYSREYGYAPRGEKVIGEISGRHYSKSLTKSITITTRDSPTICIIKYKEKG